MMSVPAYHEGQSHAPSAAAPVSADAPPTSNLNASPSHPYAYPPAPPAAPPPAATHPHNGQSPSSHHPSGLSGPGARLGPPALPVYSSADPHGLVSAVPQHHHQHHHQPTPHPHSHHAQVSHQHVVTPPMQYSSVGAGGGGHDTPTSPPGPTVLTPAGSSVSPPSKKNTRIPRACDLCSQRKVKCEGGPPPCRPCRELNVACTYERVKKRRGPPNRAAEAAREAEKRRRVVDEEEQSQVSTPSTYTAAPSLVSLGLPHGSVVLDAEQCIAPLGVLQLLVDDFFTYIHPLTPFPHEPTFRAAFRNREDRTNPEFLSLLASMMACLVTSFPRTARLHLKASSTYEKFPKSLMFVNQCMRVALAMRPSDAMLRDTVTVNDAAVSYNLCLATGYAMQWNPCRRFMGESLRFLREMGFHKRRPPPTSLSFGPERPDDQPRDFISEEIGKRIYWVIFLGVRSMTQLGASSRDLIIPPATPDSSYPDLPREVDDAYILPDRILPQPEGTVSMLTGFVKCIKGYQTMDDLVRIDLAHGLSAYTWEQQKQYLSTALLKVKEVGHSLPPELRLELNAPNATRAPFANDYQYVPPAYPNQQPTHDVRHLFAEDESKKRLVQYEIQKANIYASLLATRAHYVEHYMTLRDIYMDNKRAEAQSNASGNIVYRTAPDLSSSSLAAAAVQAVADQTHDEIDEMFMGEREEVVPGLFIMLMSIDQCNMEPNGGSLITKIRLIAGMLLGDRADRKGQYELRNEEYLRAFIEILTRLEKTGSGTTPSTAGQAGTGTMTAEDEEQELRNWADLREQQQQLARTGFVR